MITRQMTIKASNGLEQVITSPGGPAFHSLREYEFNSAWNCFRFLTITDEIRLKWNILNFNTLYISLYLLTTTHQRSWGKVMFSQMSVYPQG